MQLYDNDEIPIVIEGKIYSEDAKQLTADLRSIIRNKSDRELANYIGDRLHGIDGDFLICIFDKPLERVLIVNDLLGRLPFYYSTDNHYTIAARNEFLFPNLLNSLEIDELAVAQYLLFGYPLGTRTFYSNIERMSPGELIVVSNGDVKSYSTHTFDVSNQRRKGKTVKENATDLANIFSSVCENRTKHAGIDVVSLSGGLDSRSVLAGIADTNNVSSATFDHNRVDEPDIMGALKLARAFDIDWHRFYIEEPSGDALQDLLFLKGGMNHLTSAYLLYYNAELLDIFGDSMVLYTGNGGDKVMPDLSPNRRIVSEKNLIDYIIDNNSYYTVEKVAKMVEISPSKIYQSIHDRLQSYPESSYSDKYVRFVIRERGMNRFFQGEDRDRCFFWTASPFYSFTVFEEAMLVPNTQKEANGFYDTFIKQLDPKLLSVNNAMFGAPPGSFRHNAIRKSYSWLSEYNSLRKVINPVGKSILGLDKGRASSDSAYIRVLNDCIDDGNSADTLSKDQIKLIISNSSEYSREELGNLLTVLQVIEHSTNEKITLNDYSNTQF
ncbi:asparagine synthase-related protein [Natrialba swarupiae]|uniref:asparagine synthase-related protein n=1 Tax=Natrialba swarupiae TaxID=2448032 RepID=UPI001390CAED|nr:asparagine synthase-related protein [Natrialba swarupiae]